jgi:hypothetical protein
MLGDKICSKCNEKKDIGSFKLRTDTGKHCAICNVCVASHKREWYLQKNNINLQKSCQKCNAIIIIKNGNTKFCNNCRKEKDLKSKNKWILNNLEKRKKISLNWYYNNKEDALNYGLEYRKENNIKEKIRSLKYRGNNKEEIKKRRREKAKLNRKENLSFKLRENFSRSIRRALKSKGNYKKNSFLKNLNYSINDLKLHIENQFEFWMNKNNYGIYNSKTWNDNDPNTWAWQIDHIIPHSTFHYEDMECEEFQKCWDLSNLRPYSAKQNYLDGNRR